MMRFHVTTFLLCSAAIGWAQQTELAVPSGRFVPAGTLLGCTLDEPNFSSQTARPGDPVLCKTTSVEMFGRQVIPRGAYLSARLRNYRDPGHFFGKGWLQLEFTSLTLPGGNVPLDAKVISAAHYRVNGEGKVQGNGHPTRDAIEWSIPILWPVKVLTLPARGPRPAFKGETRIELRLMEDMLIPESAYAAPGGLPWRTSSLQPGLQPRSEERDTGLPALRLGSVGSGRTSVAAQQAVASTPIERKQAIPATNPARRWDAQPRLTLLVLRGGRVYLAADYWVDRGKLDYTTGGGALQTLPLDALDVARTQELNAERGVDFILTAKNR
jgi:hypothetical protein